MSYQRLWVVIALVLLTACSSSPFRPDDPLIGKIYQSKEQRQIDRAQLYQYINKAQVIYLGETHDNPRHHQLQFEILQMLVKQGKRPALGFEFFSVEQTSYLLQYLQAKRGPLGGPAKRNALERLRQQLGWENRDEDWDFYSPLLKLAKKNRLPVFGTDLNAGLTRRISRVGVAGLSALERRLLFPSDFKNADYQQLMYQAFTDSHCGWSQPQLLQRLYETWVARNDAMAMAIGEWLKERAGQPVVMILGAGHVANNMAVYERVAHAFPDVQQLNLGFRPVSRTPQEVNDYLQPVIVNSTHFPPAHEYIWFTPRVSYTDPCERFRKQLKKHPG